MDSDNYTCTVINVCVSRLCVTWLESTPADSYNLSTHYLRIILMGTPQLGE